MKYFRFLLCSYNFIKLYISVAIRFKNVIQFKNNISYYFIKNVIKVNFINNEKPVLIYKNIILRFLVKFKMLLPNKIGVYWYRFLGEIRWCK